MMSMKGDGKPVSFIEDCAVPLEHLAEYTDRLTQVFRQARHARHVVRARFGRLPARAADPRHAARRRAEDARDRRGSLRAGASSTRARTRASTATAWCARNGSRRSSARGSRARSTRSRRCFDPKGLHESRQDRAARRSRTTARCSASSRATRRRRSTPRSTGREWGGFDKARRDVQQQRPLPQVRRRHDVPVVSRHARRAAPHARPRQHAAARALRPARAGRVHVATRCTTRSICASRARAASANARPASTWRR